MSTNKECKRNEEKSSLGKGGKEISPPPSSCSVVTYVFGALPGDVTTLEIANSQFAIGDLALYL